MPRKTKSTAKKPSSPKNKTVNKTKYVLGQPKDLSAAEVVAKAKSAGIKLSVAHVHTIRSAAKTKAQTKGVANRATPTKPSQAKPAATGIAGLAPLDLAYAVGRLVEAGKTSTAEIVTLASERTARIDALQEQLAALKGGEVPVGEAAPTKAGRPKRPAEAPAPKRVRRTQERPSMAPPPKATSGVLPKPEAKGPAKTGQVITRKDGRKFTKTSKVTAARKLQGQYMGYLRQLPKAEQAKVKALAKDKGVGAAVEELRKRLGKK